MNDRIPSPADVHWMQRALALAARARGRTSPNPLVGAVVVRDGECVGQGTHEKAGGPHAEILALRAAGERARGSTLFVNLEPCCHAGRTPPCVPEILAAGVARVVTATEDPYSRVAGRGHRQLAAGGVEVTSGVLVDQARSLNAEYFHRVRTGRAFAVMKAAVTLDGRLGADGGDSRWITGSEARERAHELRDRYDAVLVGRGTLERDDPLLTVRGVANGRDPVAVVALSGLTPPSPRRLWERAKSGAQTIVATTDSKDEDVWRQWVDLGVEILTLGAAEGKRVRLEDLLRALAGRGLNSVLIEGGEKIHTSCLKAGIVDRAHVFVSPCILGGTQGPRLVGDLGLRRVADAFTLADPEVEVLGRDLLLTGEVVAGKGGG